MQNIKSKKADAISATFLYAIIAIFIAVIIVFGVKAIAAITGSYNAVSLEGLKSDIRAAIISQAPKYKSVEVFEFTFPKSFYEVCFVDSKAGDSYQADVKTTVLGKTEGRYALIRDAIDSDAEANIFFLGIKGVKESFYASGLDVEANMLCINNTGALRLKLKGDGDKSLLTLP